MSANTGVYTYPRHREQHGWVKPSDCEFCAREDYRATQQYAAVEAARDQALAARRDDEQSGARAVGTALLIMAAFATGVPGTWSLYLALTNLGEVHAWHVAWLPLLTTTAYVIHRLWKGGAHR